MAEAGLEGIYEENGDFHSLEAVRETGEKGKSIEWGGARWRKGRVSANFILARARRRRQQRSQQAKASYAMRARTRTGDLKIHATHVWYALPRGRRDV